MVGKGETNWAKRKQQSKKQTVSIKWDWEKQYAHKNGNKGMTEGEIQNLKEKRNKEVC